MGKRAVGEIESDRGESEDESESESENQREREREGDSEGDSARDFLEKHRGDANVGEKTSKGGGHARKTREKSRCRGEATNSGGQIRVDKFVGRNLTPMARLVEKETMSA